MRGRKCRAAKVEGDPHPSLIPRLRFQITDLPPRIGHVLESLENLYTVRLLVSIVTPKVPLHFAVYKIRAALIFRGSGLMESPII